MLRIGYVRLRDVESTSDTATLKSMGCHVVRAEEPSGDGEDGATLYSILDFIGAGDQLVVSHLSHISGSARGILDVMDRLEARRATLYVVEQDLVSDGLPGRALRAALDAVASLEPALARRKRPATQEIRELQRAGVGPVEIARRLGVSRMTVWRKLRTVEA